MRQSGGTTEAVFDTMEDLMTGGPEFNDPDFLQGLVGCMDSTNERLKEASVQFLTVKFFFFGNGQRAFSPNVLA